MCTPAVTTFMFTVTTSPTADTTQTTTTRTVITVTPLTERRRIITAP